MRFIMLTKTKYRILIPGRWARVRIPDFDCWKDAEDRFSGRRVKPGDEVDICIIPTYSPLWDSDVRFEWSYRVAFRFPGSTHANYTCGRGHYISVWDFGLQEGTKFKFDVEEHREHLKGRGYYLYEPASDDPKLCSGGDHSAYLCSHCERYVSPFSDDVGELGCPWCDTPGLVVVDEETLDKLEEARAHARSFGLLSQFESQLEWLDGYGRNDDGPRKRQCMLGHDSASLSFGFAHYWLPKYTDDKKRRFCFNGGLIYQGPGQPADGSFPSLTVSLGNTRTGWFCHT
jgi:hypothetical protein